MLPHLLLLLWLHWRRSKNRKINSAQHLILSKPVNMIFLLFIYLLLPLCSPPLGCTNSKVYSSIARFPSQCQAKLLKVCRRKKKRPIPKVSVKWLKWIHIVGRWWHRQRIMSRSEEVSNKVSSHNGNVHLGKLRTCTGVCWNYVRLDVL